MNPLFGTKHLILIAVSIALIITLYVFSRRLKFATVCKIFFVVGILSEIVKIFYYIVANEETHGGVLPKSDLPFHLCSIQIIFIAIVVLAKSEGFKRFLLSFMLPSCLVGGIAAILIATDSARNSWVITFQYFIYHIVIVVFSLHMYTSKELNFTVKDYFNCLKFLLVLMFFAIYINSIVYDGTDKINFMYVVSPPQKGLPFLNEDHGWLVYIAHYACLILFAVTACYVKPIIVAIKQKFSKNKDTSDENQNSEVA